MSRKEYKLPNGKVAVFEYDIFGIGKITLECMDELMGMIADRPQGEWIDGKCSLCGTHAPFWSMATTYYKSNFCPNCGAQMKGVDDD